MQPSGPRKLLFVSQLACPADLQEQLSVRSWELVHVRSFRSAASFLRQEPVLVSLVMADTVPRSLPGDFEPCREASDLCEWVGVFPPGAMAAPVLRDVILRHFFDHHTLPADPRFLCQSLGHAHGRAMLRRMAAQSPSEDLGIVGVSPAMIQLRRVLRKAAAGDTPVLLTGEAGTGKETAAMSLHRLSRRAAEPFVVVDCRDPGADFQRLFNSAQAGTLFLEHVSELPREAQSKLLRLLLEKALLRSKLGRDFSADTRVVASTETPLSQAVAQERFREDLFYRLNVLAFSVPPLRERREDIAPLAHHFHAAFSRSRPSSAKGFSREALSAMAAHDWRGNVRELMNRVESALVLAEHRMIGPVELGLRAPSEPQQPLDSLETIRVQAEKSAITTSLDRFSHNVSLAARELGVSRMTLYRLMAKHSIHNAKAGA